MGEKLAQHLAGTAGMNSGIMWGMNFIAIAIGALATCSLAIPKFVYKNRGPTIMEVCRDLAEDARKFANKSESEKAIAVKFLKIAANYDCRSRSIVMADRLDSQLGGVLADKGQKIIDEARKNSLCPVFLAAVAMHESANGESKCARDKNNTFGIFDSKTRRHKYFTNVDVCLLLPDTLEIGRLNLTNSKF